MKNLLAALHVTAKLCLVVSFSLISFLCSAQIAINPSGTQPNSSAILDLQAGNSGVNKGFLPNAVALTATNSPSPVVGPATGLIVYNTATAGTSPNNVVPGYYYWNGSSWALIVNGSTPNGNSWNLKGNSVTTVGTNFIGTTDANALEFEVEGQKAGYIDYNPNIGNTSFGFEALKSTTTTSFGNTAYGYQALDSNTTGNENTANGYGALFSNKTGFENTANGWGSLYFNTTGNSNTANGISALYYNTTGYSNTANGASALSSNTTGSNNTANGAQSLYFNTTGSENTANGVVALYSNTTGSSNTADGFYALTTNTTGTNNTALGYNADVASGTLTNATAIGANATVSASNCLVLGNGVNVGIGCSSPAYTFDVTGNIRATGSVYYGGTACTTTGATAYTKPDYVFEPDYKQAFNTDEVAKFIAENGHLPWVTSAADDKKENKGAVDMTRMSFQTLEAVENTQNQIIEQQKMITEQKASIIELKKQNEELKQQVSALAKSVNQLLNK